VTPTFAHALVVGAVLICCGVLAVVWRRERGLGLLALPLLAAGAAVCVAAAGRFAGRQDPDAGRELAVLISLFGLAASIVGASWMRRGVTR